MAFGEVFVGALLQVLFEKLASGAIGQILKYVKGKKIDPNTVKNFENNLRMIAALLQDAEQKRIESAAFKIWVEKLQDLAYDLDDILDELTTDAQLQLQLQQQGQDDDEDYGFMACNVTCLHAAKTKIKSILACGSRVEQRFHYSGEDIPFKIEEINNRLQQIHTDGQGLGLVDRLIKPDMHYPTEATRISGRETTSLVNESILFGREEKKRDVIRELLKEEPGNEKYDVIPIVGNGGIGKTTLAQYVYNDQQLKDHFKIKAWVCVSDVFDMQRVTTDIINSSKNTNLKFNSLDQAQNELKDVIRDKRFLIVLDDIWTRKYNDWSILKAPFQYGAMGSKVIVTTRYEKIATMIMVNRTHPIFNLEGLSNEDCWGLFKQHANVDANELIEMKDDILDKCKGLPLAAKALGGLFRGTREKRDRKMILRNNIWTEESQVLPVLRLSYYHLPSHLKHIFAFCCILPKDYEFEEMEVILLWMAQGFLLREEEDRFEDIGHRYFQDLVSRSLFEHSPSNEKYYVMHDLVHDLAQWAAGDICHCVGDMENMQRKVERTRHLHITSSGRDHTLRNIDESVLSKLRTLICRSSRQIGGLNFGFGDLITRFQYIRTLLLASNTIEELPESIGDLKHLRFLDLKFTKMQVLPNSIRKLCNLQVFFLDGCCNLREVTNISFLVKLRHLRFHQTLWEAMPWGFGKLINLQSLGGSIYLGDDNKIGSIIRELGSLNHLQGELSIEGIKNVPVDDAREAQLHEKKGLTKLYLNWGHDWWDDLTDDWNEVDDKNARDVMEALRPATCMEEVKLEGYKGMKLPSWLGDGSFKNVVSIKLIGCEKCECLPPLGQLPLLKKLVVKDMRGIREVGPSVFSSPSCLEELRVVDCDILDTVNEIPFSLVMLKIKRCPNLEKVEFKKSLPFSAPKKATIDIFRCKSLLTVGRIPLTVEGLVIHDCGKVKYLLFGDMSAESEEEEEKAEVAGRRQGASEGVGSRSMEVSKKQNQIKSPIELAHLLKLEIFDCSNFISLPEDLILPSVQSLGFYNNEEQEALPEQIHTFTSLKHLRIEGCPNVRRFPKGGLPKTETLTSISMEDLKIEEPPIREWGFHLLPHLQTLDISNIGSITDEVERIPGPHLPLPLPSSLSKLWIKGFKNLKSINWACFPNLTLLFILECPKLENFGDYNSPPPNLSELKILDCPMIQKQCQPDPNGLIKFTHNNMPRYSLIRR